MKANKNISLFVLLSILAILALCLCITATASTGAIAYAAETTEGTTPTTEPEVTTPTNEAKIGEVEYETLAKALTSAVAGDTITLLKDITWVPGSTTYITKSIVFDLNNFKITLNKVYGADGAETINKMVINGSDIDVTIQNGIIENQQTISNSMAVHVYLANSVIFDNITITGRGYYGLYATPSVKDFTVRNSNISAYAWAIRTQNNGLFTLDNSTVIASYYGVYAWGNYTDGNLTKQISTSLNIINNCSITGNTYGVSFRGSTGSLTIQNGTINAASSTGVDLLDCGDTTLTNCTITAPWGVYSKANGGLTIDGGVITSESQLISDYSLGNSVIKNCELIGEATSSAKGVFIKKDTATTTLYNVKIKNTFYAILVYRMGAVTIENCTIDQSEMLVGQGYPFEELDESGNTVTNYYFPTGITGNGTIGNGDTNITVKNTTMTTGTGIYHPQVGTLVVDGGVINAKDLGIEMRAGDLTLQNGAVINVDASTVFNKKVHGSGATCKGVAVAVSQHYDERHAPIKVHVKDAILTGNKSLIQVDTKPEEPKVDVTINIEGGKYHGPVETERVNEFIHGGRFDQEPPIEYINPEKTVIVDHGYHLVTTPELGDAILYADDYVRLYAATKGIPYTEEIYSIIRNGNFATLNEIRQAKEEAVAKVDELYNALVQAKLDAITEIKEAAGAVEASEGVEAQAEVVVPTATYSAINDAMDIAQVEEFKNNALAEIEDIRAFRQQVSDLGAKGDEILSVINALNKALLGDETADGKLEGIKKELKEYLDGVKGEIKNYTLGQLTSVKDELNQKIEGAVTELNTAISNIKTVVDSNATKLEALGGNVTAIKEKVDTLQNADLTNVEKALGDLKTELASVKKTVEGIVNDIITNDEFTKLAKTTDVEAVGNALAGFKADLLTADTGALAKLQSALETAIANVQKTANSNANALEALGIDVADIKNKVLSLNNTDLSTLEQKISDVKNSVETAVANLETKLNEKVATLESNLNSLTGRLNEVNGGLRAELDIIKEKIEGIDLASVDSLAETLNEVKINVDAVAESVLAVVDVEQEKAKALDKINQLIGNLLSTANETEVALLASADTAKATELTSVQREKLHAMYNDKMADLIEQYYNNAVADIENATTVEEAQFAFNSFKGNVDSARLMNSLSAQEGKSGIAIDDVYVMIIITCIFAALAVVLSLAVFVQKRKVKKQ